jgi:hypothetical protein
MSALDIEKELLVIHNRLSLAYRLCCGLAPKQAVGEMLDVVLKMPEWESILDAAKRATQSAPSVPAPVWATDDVLLDEIFTTIMLFRRAGEDTPFAAETAQRCSRVIFGKVSKRIEAIKASKSAGTVSGGDAPWPGHFSPTIVDCDGLPQAMAAILRSHGNIIELANLYALIDAWGEKQRNFAADRAAIAAKEGKG